MNLLLLLLLGAIWGSSFLFIKVIVGEVPVMTLVAGRLVMSSAVLWGVLAIKRVRIPRDRKLWANYAVMGFFSCAVPYGLISWGEVYITSGLAALLQATMPIFTVIMANLVSKEERLKPIGVFGILVGFAGVAILFLPDLQKGLHTNLLGQLAIIGASICYAATAIFARKRLRGNSPLVSSMGQLTTGAIFTLPLALLVDRPFPLSPSPAAIGSWLGLAILGTAVAYIIYWALIERTSATFVSTVTYIVPINGLILGSVVLGEPLTALLLVSLAMILAGVLLVQR